MKKKKKKTKHLPPSPNQDKPQNQKQQQLLGMQIAFGLDGFNFTQTPYGYASKRTL